MMNYETWRITYQESEQAARAAFHEYQKLLAIVRSAETLADVKRKIGPTQEEENMAVQRISRLDMLWSMADEKGWGCLPDKWPWPHGDEYKRITAEQIDFENMYC